MADVLVNTDMLIKMLEAGIVPRLPEVVLSEEQKKLHPDFVPLAGDMNDIVAVEYDGEEEVQCIMIDDSDHLYLTDGYIPTHNTSNIVFLKSTDDSMLDTLQKMSGVTHKSFVNSKTVTRNQTKFFMQNNADMSYTVSTQEVPVITYNDMAFISERNSIVFRAGDSPVWNRNETILPMSWRLFKNTIEHAGHEYSLQTIPTLSSALDFDVRKNQPDFNKMLEKRRKQALLAKKAKDAYQEAYGYSDYEIEQLDPDNYSDEIMSIINTYLDKSVQGESGQGYDSRMEEDDFFAKAETNTEQLKATQEQERKQQEANRKIYAGGFISREDLVSSVTGVNHQFDKDIIAVYTSIMGDMQSDMQYFRVINGNLCGINGEVYIEKKSETESLQSLNEAAKDPKSRVFQDGPVDAKAMGEIGSYSVHDAFIRFLVSQNRWKFANGRFEAGMERQMNQ